MGRRSDTTFPSTARCSPIISVVVLLFFQVTGRLLVAPQNQVALLGENVKLDCSTDLSVSVNWEHIPLGSTKPRDVYLSRAVVFPYHPRFTVQREEVGVSITAYNLVVTDVRVEDAGTYRCTDRTGMGEKQSAELTVLGSLPNCTTNIGPNGFICENDCHYPIEKIHSSCSIEYTGNIAPDMKWMITPGQDTIQPQPITNVSEKTVSSVLNVEASESMNGASVVWYSMQSTQVKWTSVPIKTLSAKQNLSQVILTQSGNITCAANASQDCSFTWIVKKMDQDNKLQTIERRTIEVSEPGTYLCHAHCPLHHASCTVIAMHVEYRNGDKCKHKNGYWGVAFGLLTIVFLAIVVIMAIYIIWKLRAKRHCPSDSHPSKSGEPPSKVHLLDPHHRTPSNSTSSSNSTSLQSSGSEKPCLS